MPLFDEIAKKSFQSGKLPADRTLAANLGQGPKIGAHDVMVHLLDLDLFSFTLAQSLLVQKLLKLLKIAQIISHSVRRKIALDAQIIPELFDQILHDWPL